MVDIIIALSILCSILFVTTIYFGVFVVMHVRKEKRVCDICKTFDDAYSYAIHEGYVDCSEFTARDMANLLLRPLE